jgi:hypothetical protein
MGNMKSAFLMHRGLLLVALGYAFCISVLLAVKGASLPMTVFSFSYLLDNFAARLGSMVGFVAMLLLGAAALRAAKDRAPAALPRHFKNVWNEYLADGMLEKAMVGVLLLLVVLLFFSTGKSLIPHLVPYHWDEEFAAADRWLHFGKYPHEYLIPFIDAHQLGRFMELAYVGWFPFMLAANAYCVFWERDAARRMRYLWANTLCWIVSGTMLAVLFSSTGPIFYADFYTDVPAAYTDLIAWLNTADGGKPLPFLEGAWILRDLVKDPALPDINAISAMPSQHIALAGIITLYMFSVHRVLGAAALTYLVLTFASCVVLGAHYAVDGYVALVLAAGLWALAGKIPVRRDENPVLNNAAIAPN